MRGRNCYDKRPVPSGVFGNYQKKYHEMVKQAKPMMCWFSTTEACNLRCKFCFAGSHFPLENELSTTEALKVIDNIAEAGTEAIVFGGGEPSSRKDLLELANYAVNRHGMMASLNTNGQLLADKHYVRALASAGFSQIKISVDGLKDSHDWNRGKGTFEKCIQALKNCVEEEFPSIWLIATISKLNFDEIRELTKLGVELGVDVGMVQLLPIGRGEATKNLMLSKEQTREWQRILVEQKKIYGASRVLFEDRYQISEDEAALNISIDPERIGTYLDSPAGCVTGIWQYIIGADGQVYVGDVIAPEMSIGNLRESKLSDLWSNSELINLLRDRDKLKGKCGRCELRFVCGGCRRMAYGLTGDIMASDPQCWYEPRLGKD
jgi:radical SAM additional 4Fe4S-binding domain